VAVVALLLVAVLVAATRHAKQRPVTGDRSLDSMLTAAKPASAAPLVDSAPRRPKRMTAAQRRKWHADSVAYARRVVAAGTVDLAPVASDRCRSAASDDQRACLMTAIASNDVAMSEAYGALIADLRKRSAGDAATRAVDALRAEQRAWIDQRDRDCRAAVPETNGKLWGAARIPCFAQHSAQRAAQLRARIGH
jgi:uncharacterized protein YecT (DUF1311 family)